MTVRSRSPQHPAKNWPTSPRHRKSSKTRSASVSAYRHFFDTALTTLLEFVIVIHAPCQSSREIPGKKPVFLFSYPDSQGGDPPVLIAITLSIPTGPFAAWAILIA